MRGVSAGAQLQTWTARWRRQRWVVFTVDSVEGPLVRALVHGERVALLQFGMIRTDAWPHRPRQRRAGRVLRGGRPTGPPPA